MPQLRRRRHAPQARARPHESPSRMPKLADIVDILWEDRSQVFRGVLQTGRGSQFTVLYEDGDIFSHDLDDHVWRFADGMCEWWQPGDMAGLEHGRKRRREVEKNRMGELESGCSFVSVCSEVEGGVGVRSREDVSDSGGDTQILAHGKRYVPEAGCASENADMRVIELRKHELSLPPKKRFVLRA